MSRVSTTQIATINKLTMNKMSVKCRLKVALDFCTVTFDGIQIFVTDLKNGTNVDFDLQSQNAQTKEGELYLCI